MKRSWSERQYCFLITSYDSRTCLFPGCISLWIGLNASIGASRLSSPCVASTSACIFLQEKSGSPPHKVWLLVYLAASQLFHKTNSESRGRMRWSEE